MFTNIEDRFVCRSTERIPVIQGLAWLEVALAAWCRLASRLGPLCFEALGRRCLLVVLDLYFPIARACCRDAVPEVLECCPVAVDVCTAGRIVIQHVDEELGLFPTA